MLGCLCSGRELERNGGGSMRICGASLMSDGGGMIWVKNARTRKASGGSQEREERG